MPCHGCHLQMGQGAHQGSVPGKNHCTLLHSLACPGGIVEDEAWRACPDGYTYHAQVVPETGFQSTMNQSGFAASTPVISQGDQVGQTPSVLSSIGGAQSMMAQQQIPTISTPMHPHLGGVQLQPVGDQLGLAQSWLSQQAALLTTSVQATGLVTTTAPVQSSPTVAAPATTSVLSPTTAAGSLPPAVSPSIPGNVTPTPPTAQDQLLYDMLRLSLQQLGEGARPKTSAIQPVQPLPAVPQNIQVHVDNLRAANQQVFTGAAAPASLSIGDLRGMPALQGVVDSQLQVLRGSIPALSAAKSAPAPGLPQQPATPASGAYQPFSTAVSGSNHHQPLHAAISQPQQQPQAAAASQQQQFPQPATAGLYQQQPVLATASHQQQQSQPGVAAHDQPQPQQGKASQHPLPPAGQYRQAGQSSYVQGSQQFLRSTPVQNAHLPQNIQQPFTSGSFLPRTPQHQGVSHPQHVPQQVHGQQP